MLYEVITSRGGEAPDRTSRGGEVPDRTSRGGEVPDRTRITSYNVCYTKLLRSNSLTIIMSVTVNTP